MVIYFPTINLTIFSRPFLEFFALLSEILPFETIIFYGIQSGLVDFRIKNDI
ncbi:hypothetical protein D9M68_292500 [compost metagenome]